MHLINPSVCYTYPSRLGTEKIAMKMLEGFLNPLSIRIYKEKLDEIKTVLAEACLNAIEHGNAWDDQKVYSIALEVEQSCLWIRVYDQGQKIPNKKCIVKDFRDVKNAFANESTSRGWGLQLIDQFADHWDFHTGYGKVFLEIQMALK